MDVKKSKCEQCQKETENRSKEEGWIWISSRASIHIRAGYEFDKRFLGKPTTLDFCCLPCLVQYFTELCLKGCPGVEVEQQVQCTRCGYLTLLAKGTCLVHEPGVKESEAAAEHWQRDVSCRLSSLETDLGYLLGKVGKSMMGIEEEKVLTSRVKALEADVRWLMKNVKEEEG